MTKYDILDMFEAYETEATFTKGNMKTTSVVAMEDIIKVVDELVLKLSVKTKSKKR